MFRNQTEVKLAFYKRNKKLFSSGTKRCHSYAPIFISRCIAFILTDSFLRQDKAWQITTECSCVENGRKKTELHSPGLFSYLNDLKLHSCPSTDCNRRVFAFYYLLSHSKLTSQPEPSSHLLKNSSLEGKYLLISTCRQPFIIVLINSVKLCLRYRSLINFVKIPSYAILSYARTVNLTVCEDVCFNPDDCHVRTRTYVVLYGAT